jgi:hypothetical protein
MRKIILLPFFFQGGGVFLTSCKKESHDNMGPATTDETINVKVAQNQLFQINMVNAGSVTITRQASHSAISEVGVNNETGALVYKYIPAKDFTGSDELVLLSSKTETNYSPNNGGGGCQNANNGNTGSYTKHTYTTLKITVGN